MGRKWTQDDLLAYKIKVVYQDRTTFFGMTDLPPPDVASDALTAHHFSSSKDRWTRAMLFNMDHVTDPKTDPVNIAPETVSFVRDIFNITNYPDVAKERFEILWTKLPYLGIASPGRPPGVDICITDDDDIILLIAKVARPSRGFDPEPRLISDAIAAFHNDNIMRVKRLGTNPIASKVMPGIVMNGIMPTFYKIPITAELVTAVEAGENPEQETIVYAYLPEVPRPEEGMRPLDNRYIILSCFEAFKQFL
jgi:hypothetical protein